MPAMADAIREHGVSHYCGAPIVHSLLVNAPGEVKQCLPRGVKAMVAGACLDDRGHGEPGLRPYPRLWPYRGLRPGQHEDWERLDIGERARLNARQGVRYHLQRAAQVLDPQTMKPVPWDGETMGEIMFRGNITMGYLKKEKATQEVVAGGWFHIGDLAVQYPDGYIKIKDRSKDIIISGGENICSIEVEDVLYRHPAVLAAAVVAKPDPKVGRDALRLHRAQGGCAGAFSASDRNLGADDGPLLEPVSTGSTYAS